MNWDFRNGGRAWGRDEAWARFVLTPEKRTEMVGARILSSDQDRETLLALPLENAGADGAVQIGDQEVWRRAAAKLAH